MKIGIELLSPLPGKCGAVSNLWRNNLSLFPLVDKGIEYVVFLRPELFDYYEKNIEIQSNLKFHLCNLSSNSVVGRIRFQELVIPKLLKEYGCDILFTSTPTPTYSFQMPIEIFKITGIQFYSRPKEFGWLRSLYHIYSTRKKALRSKYIVVNSHYVKKEILKRLNLPEHKIKVIYESLDHEIFNVNKSIAECKKISRNNCGIASKFLLYVSDMRPYKNPLSLIKAYESLKDELNGYQLVMIGQDVGGYKQHLIEYIREKYLLKDVVMFDYMEPFKFVYLMRAAEVFIYPSSLETFGTIPLEAMACGTPVIAGNETAIPEICGDSALLVDGKNPDELAHAIFKIVTNENLKSELIEKGLNHVKNYSWQKNAFETIHLFKQVMAN